MDPYDFTPSVRALQSLLAETTDDQLGASTPCPDYTVADLCDHIGGLTIAFTDAARKSSVSHEPSGDGNNLEAGWRERIEADLDALAAAWQLPEAYEGMTTAGPIDLPGEVAAQVALNEVVVHGWDLAVATGQAYAADPTAVELCRAFVATFDVEGEGPFGPPVPVPEGAGPLEQLVGLTGRSPDWAS